MRKAFSLSITLFISIVLLAIISYFVYISNKNIYFAKELNNKLEVYLSELSLSHKINFFLSTGSKHNYYITNNLNNFFKELRVDSYEYNYSKCRFTLQDSNGLYSLLYPNINFLNYILDNEKKKTILIDSFLDWLDKDNLIRPSGAEEDFYVSHNYHYIPRNRNYINYKDELLDIREWKNIYSKYSRYMIFSQNSVNNYLTMPYFLLKAKYNIELNNYKELQSLKNNTNNLKALRDKYYETIKSKSGYDYMSDMPFISNNFKIYIKCQNNEAVYTHRYIYNIFKGILYEKN